MKIVAISSCYPSKNSSFSGIFVHQQLKALVQLGVEVHLLQVANWFPPFGLHKLHPYWKEGFNERMEMLDELEGVRIHHLSHFVRMPNRIFRDNQLDKIGELIGKYILNNKQLKETDWIYAHFLWYEGYIGSIASRLSRVPLAAIALGDDVHAWPEKNKKIADSLPFVFKTAKLLMGQ